MKLPNLRISPYFTLLFIVFLSTLVVWLPFLLKVENWYTLHFVDASMHTLYRHFDGPLYIIAAKSWYDPEIISKLRIELPISANYFAAHLPLYPALIRVFAMVFGYLRATMVVSVVATAGLAWMFYYVVSHLKLTKHPLLLTSVMLFLPRFLVVRTVGAPESLFLLLVLVSVFFFEKKQFFFAGLFGGLSVMTKSPGILLTFAYGLVCLESLVKHRKFELGWLWLSLVPAGFLAVCGIYAMQYGDFYAYFNSGDNIHLVAPFAAFNAEARWIGTAWLEEIVLYFGMYILAVVTLKDSPYRSFFYFPLVFLIATSFVEHRDISRYALPLWPFACIAFQQFFTSKKFLIAACILLPAIYLYAWNFMLHNVMPISDWSAYM